MLYLYLCVQVIRSREMEKAELELFPRHLLFLRQQPPARTPQSNGWMNMGKAEHIRITREFQDCIQIRRTLCSLPNCPFFCSDCCEAKKFVSPFDKKKGGGVS